MINKRFFTVNSYEKKKFFNSTKNVNNLGVFVTFIKVYISGSRAGGTPKKIFGSGSATMICRTRIFKLSETGRDVDLFQYKFLLHLQEMIAEINAQNSKFFRQAFVSATRL
jgi:hypothetical protein